MRRMLLVAAPILTLAVASCSDSTSPDAVRLLSVTPSASTTAVSVTTSVVLTFSGAMMAGMETRVMLHEGSVTGPVVEGVAAWSADRTVLTFTPRMPLKPRTTYVIHLAGQMRSADGAYLDRGSCSAQGGRSVTSGMMGDRGTGSMMDGWRGADGTYGMAFTFTTA